MSYKIMKMFDAQEMPGDVRGVFFSFSEDLYIGNDMYVPWTVQEDETNYDNDNEFSIKRRLVDKWLIENGAEPRQGKYNGETVIIKHWW